MNDTKLKDMKNAKDMVNELNRLRLENDMTIEPLPYASSPINRFTYNDQMRSLSDDELSRTPLSSRSYSNNRSISSDQTIKINNNVLDQLDENDDEDSDTDTDISDLQDNKSNNNNDNNNCNEFQFKPLQFLHPSAQSTKKRSHSTMSFHEYELNNAKLKGKIKKLRGKTRRRETQLILLREKITNIQDDREDDEDMLTNDYELKLNEYKLKLDDQQNENLKLKQLIVLQSNQLKLLKTDAFNKQYMPQYQYGYYNNQNQLNNMKHTYSNINNINNIQNITQNDHHILRSPSTPTSRSSVLIMKDNMDDIDDIDDDDDDIQDQKYDDKNVINMDPNMNTNASRNQIKKKKQYIPDRLNNDLSQRQPKGFWGRLLSLFGPPGVFCSCSDKR